VRIVDQLTGASRIGNALGEREKDLARRERQRPGVHSCGQHDGLVAELPFVDLDAPFLAQRPFLDGHASRHDGEIGIAAESEERLVVLHVHHARLREVAVLRQASDEPLRQRPR
jgi:hypothetical protein